MGEYQTLWNNAKTKFSNDTGGKHKPSKTFLKVRVSSGLENAAGAIDNAVAAYSPKVGWTLPQAATMASATKEFRKKAKSYLDLLTSTIEKEKKDAAKLQGEEQKAEKEKAEVYIRATKVLKTSLDAIVSKAETAAAMAQAAAEGIGAAEATAKNFMVSLKGAVARAAAAIQQIKQNPTGENYKSFFPKIARDMTQQLGNLTKLRNKYPQYNLPFADGDGPFDDLTPWADGDRGTGMAVDATKEEVLRELKAFSAIVKTVKTDFAL
ncbi:MAG TPA: hypothetical protein VGE52_15190 [Pirellulales bacterium]